MTLAQPSKIFKPFSGQQPRRSELVLLELELSQETTQRYVKFCVVYSYTNTRVKEFLTKARNGAITFDICDDAWETMKTIILSALIDILLIFFCSLFTVSLWWWYRKGWPKYDPWVRFTASQSQLSFRCVSRVNQNTVHCFFISRLRPYITVYL